MENRQTTSFRCGVPAYLTGLDEPIFDCSRKNFVVYLDEVGGSRRADTRITSAISRHPEFSKQHSLTAPFNTDSSIIFPFSRPAPFTLPNRGGRPNNPDDLHC